MSNILAITTTTGVVEPTEEGVEAIERLVRNGRSLAEAVAHINGGPAMFKGEKS